MKNVPNLFTLLNLVFGCLAIVFVLQNGITISGDAEGATWIDIPEKIWMASLFIGIAAVIDFLDGFVARLFKASSEMGKQLDSFKPGERKQFFRCFDNLVTSRIHYSLCRSMAFSPV
jgi:CDP-diacylglycerol--serine O-phosphatidyltransferase